MYTEYYTNSEGDIAVDSSSRLASIKYMIIDVDGTMTDGGIYYDNHGNELKKFCTKDAAAFFTAKVCGIKTIILTGRECEATLRRMTELQAGMVVQGVTDKKTFLFDYIEKNDISKNEIAYIGDDLNDYSSMLLTGFVACPKDSVDEIKSIANYISIKKGGEGAVRDVMEYVLKERGQWRSAIEQCYKTMLLCK